MLVHVAEQEIVRGEMKPAATRLELAFDILSRLNALYSASPAPAVVSASAVVSAASVGSPVSPRVVSSFLFGNGSNGYDDGDGDGDVEGDKAKVAATAAQQRALDSGAAEAVGKQKEAGLKACVRVAARLVAVLVECGEVPHAIRILSSLATTVEKTVGRETTEYVGKGIENGDWMETGRRMNGE